MRTGAWVALIGVLTAVVAVLAYVVFIVPAPSVPGEAATTTGNGAATTSRTTQPLSARVQVTSPAAGSTVGKSFVIAGQAPGPWFFEASFPIKVIAEDGAVLLNTFATAQGEWMTTHQVTFTAVVSVSTYTGPATVVLIRDNPSGLPEHDDSVEIPIIIK